MGIIASLLTAALGFAGDEATKKLVRDRLKGREISLFDGKVRLMHRENGGFAMNKFESDRKLVTSVSAVVFILLLVTYIPVLTDEGLKALRPGLSLVLAGAAGNVYDRIVRGNVTDFINVSFLKKIVFNLADIFIVVGGLMTILAELMSKSAK